MVGAHGAGGVGDADAFDRTGVIGRYALVFYDRHAGDAIGLADRAGAATQDAPERCAPADFLGQNAQHLLAVSPRQDSGFHGYPEHDRGFDRIDADVVHQVVGAGDVVQVVDAAVRTQPPDSLVFKAGCYVLALLVVIDLRTLDDAAGMAAVLRFAAAGDDGVMHGLAGDLVGPVEVANREVAGRQAASLVEDVDQHVGAVGRQAFAADRVVHQGLGKDAGGRLEFFRIGDRHLGCALVVDGDELDLLGAHHGAEAAPAMAADLAVRVLDRDVGGGHLHFAGRSDGQDAGFLAEPRFDGFNHGEIPFADQLGFFPDRDTLHRNVQAVPLVFLGDAFDDQRLYVKPCQHLGGGAAGVTLLDGAGQGALGAGREPARVGGRGAGQQTRGKDQLVVGAQCMTGGRHFGGDDGRGQAAPAQACPGCGNCFGAGAQVVHVDADYFIHSVLLPILYLNP